MVTYDLNKADKDYSALYRAMGQLGECHKDPDLDSVWFISTVFSPSQVFNNLASAMDKNDRLFISRIRPGEYTGWLSTNAVSWLAKKVI